MLHNEPEGEIITLEGNKLKQVDDFKYFGSWIQSSGHGEVWGHAKQNAK